MAKNAETVRRGMEAFSRHDFDAALQFVAEDATWAPFVARTETALLRGKDEIRGAWERQLEAFDDLRVEVIEVVADANDRVIARTLLTGRGRGSDLPIEGRYVTVFTFRDGLTSSVESYGSVAEALEAAGLSE